MAGSVRSSRKASADARLEAIPGVGSGRVMNLPLFRGQLAALRSRGSSQMKAFIGIGVQGWERIASIDSVVWCSGAKS